MEAIKTEEDVLRMRQACVTPAEIFTTLTQGRSYENLKVLRGKVTKITEEIFNRTSELT